jgi:hypothetical protein
MYVTYTNGECQDCGQSELHKAGRDRSCTKPTGIGILMLLAHFHGNKQFRGILMLAHFHENKHFREILMLLAHFHGNKHFKGILMLLAHFHGNKHLEEF